MTKPPAKDTDRLEPAPEGRFVPRLVTVLDAARLLGVGRTTIYELIARGQVEVVHIGRAARIPVSSIDEFVDQLRAR